MVPELKIQSNAAYCNKKQGETPMAVPGNLRGCADPGRASELALQGAGRGLEAQEAGRTIRCIEVRPGQGGQTNQRNEGQRPMKTNPSDELKAPLAAAENIEACLANEAKLLRDSGDEKNALQKVIDISDGGQLARMATLLVIEQVGQPRRTYRHQEQESALKTLVDSSQSFVSNVFAPRLRDMEARAVVVVETNMDKHFSNKDALRSAVQHSTELQALGPIKEAAHMFSYRTDDAIRLAKILLEGWRAADAFEAKYLS